MWPPNSPGLNKLDYSIWNKVNAKAFRKPHPNLKSLKAPANKAWRNLDHAYVMRTCSAFRGLVEQVVAAGVSIIE